MSSSLAGRATPDTDPLAVRAVRDGPVASRSRSEEDHSDRRGPVARRSSPALAVGRRCDRHDRPRADACRRGVGRIRSWCPRLGHRLRLDRAGRGDRGRRAHRLAAHRGGGLHRRGCDRRGAVRDERGRWCARHRRRVGRGRRPGVAHLRDRRRGRHPGQPWVPRRRPGLERAAGPRPVGRSGGDRLDSGSARQIVGWRRPGLRTRGRDRGRRCDVDRPGADRRSVGGSRRGRSSGDADEFAHAVRLRAGRQGGGLLDGRRLRPGGRRRRSRDTGSTPPVDDDPAGLDDHHRIREASEVRERVPPDEDEVGLLPDLDRPHESRRSRGGEQRRSSRPGSPPSPSRRAGR